MRYIVEPLTVPAEQISTKELTEYLQRTLQQISDSLQALYNGEFETNYALPPKRRDANLKYFTDAVYGTGSEGFYLASEANASWRLVAAADPYFGLYHNSGNVRGILFENWAGLTYDRSTNTYSFEIGLGSGMTIDASGPYVNGYPVVTTYSYTAADVLAKLLTVDGGASGLDAQYLDTKDATYFKNASNLNAGTVNNARINWASPDAIGGTTPAMGTFTGLAITGSGTYAAGTIYADANWGMIFRAKQASPSQAEFLWTNSAGTDLARITGGGAIGITDGITAPGTVTSVAHIYVDTADGDLKVKFGDGVVKTLATDT